MADRREGLSICPWVWTKLGALGPPQGEKSKNPFWRGIKDMGENSQKGRPG